MWAKNLDKSVKHSWLEDDISNPSESERAHYPTGYLCCRQSNQIIFSQPDLQLFLFPCALINILNPSCKSKCKRHIATTII